jgi:hypothetical protein
MNTKKGEACSLAKLTDERVREIRRRRQTGESYRTIAMDMGVSRQIASKAARGKTWAHVK